MDGTLCDTFEDIYLSLKHTLEKNNLKSPDRNTIRSFIGDGLAMLVERTLNVHGNSDYKDKIMNDFMVYYEKHCVQMTKLFDGMDKVLQEFKARDINMGVISNKAFKPVNIILNHLQLDKFFSFIYGGDSFSEKKPYPLPIVSGMNALNISHDNVLMIGDSDNDIIAGKSAGVKTCYCSYGYTTLAKSSPDFQVSSPADILDIIGLL